MKPDDFEKRLQRLPIRRIPSEWREQILQSAKQSTLDTRPPFLQQLSTVLWLKPKAWAGLAAVWVVIFALQSTSQKHAGIVATVSPRQSSSLLMSLKEEQQTLVELMGNNQPDDMDQPRRAVPKPRSELRGRFRVV